MTREIARPVFHRVTGALLTGLLLSLSFPAWATDAEVRSGSVVTTIPLHALREAETRKLELGGERLEIVRQDGRIRFSYLGPVSAPFAKPEVAAGLPADDPNIKCMVLVGERAISAYTLASKTPWASPVTSVTATNAVPGCTDTPQLECGSGAIQNEPRASGASAAAGVSVSQFPKLSVQCFPR